MMKHKAGSAVQRAEQTGLANTHVFERVYRECAPLARAAATRVLGDPEAAEDVVQDVFLGLWQRPERFDPRRASAATYITMVARCRALDAARSRTAATGAVERLSARERGTLAAAAGPDEIALARDDARRAVRALRAVPVEQRRAVALRLLLGLSTDEVAELERSPTGTVKSRVRLGLAKARAELEKTSARSAHATAFGSPPARQAA
jgi:RNA polymerase sigma-70 factor (ECF subfamily)